MDRNPDRAATFGGLAGMAAYLMSFASVSPTIL